MGCCQSDTTNTEASHIQGKRPSGHDKASNQSFQGMGHRLGSLSDSKPTQTSKVTSPQYIQQNQTKSAPLPLSVDQNMDDEAREKLRRDRAAAAEARAKKQQVGGKKPSKRYSEDNMPLRGPNSRNTMQWSLG